ncbi:MAG: hypothetical protein H0X27_00320 [Caulobacteraceae bacterium]|nr:hypothetical protein [Caulobacteraceae bacterium]
MNNQAFIAVIDSGSLQARGEVDNTGTIALTGIAMGSTLTVLAGNLTLTGGGVVSLGDFAGNAIFAAASTGTLTNVDNTISGDGFLGNGQLTLVNQSGGVIRETGSSGLIIDTGGSTITNAGLIESSGQGGMTIDNAVTNTGVIENDGAGGMIVNGPVKNTGRIIVDGGTLAIYEAVSGNGTATIKNGTLKFGAAFNEDVNFTTQSGILELAQSQSYTKTVTGIAINGGGDFLELDDISFVSADEASYVDNGMHTGGVLTVTDGTHSAHIKLVGDYRPSGFGVQSDGNGGVNVFYSTLPTAPPRTATSGRFVAAMASLGSEAVGVAHLSGRGDYAHPTMLSVPRMAMA